MTKFAALYDLEPLTETQRQEYVAALCNHMGIPADLNLVMLTYLDEDDGPRRLVPWVKRGGTEIIRNNRGINITEITHKEVGGSFVVTAKAVNSDGRQEIALGSKWIQGLQNKDLDDAIMTAQTRACRRVTLQFVGAGVLDESEINPALRVSAKQTTPIATAPLPTVQPASEPGKDITKQVLATAVAGLPEPFVGQQDQIDGAWKQVEEKKQKTREEVIAELNQKPEVIPGGEAAAEPVKKRAGRKRKVDLGPGEPPAPKESAPVSLSTTAASQPIALSAPVPATAVTTPESPKAQPVQPPVPTGTPAELVKPYRTRLFQLTQKLELEGGFAPKEGIGNQAKLQQFAGLMFPDVTGFKFMTQEQWEKFVSTLEAKLAAEGPVKTVAYIEDAIGL